MPEVKRVNRRRGPDALTKAIRVFAILSWILAVLVLMFMHYGKPRMGFSFTGLDISNKSMMDYVNVILVLVFFVCFIGFLINLNRNKRKSDRISKTLIFFGFGSIIWLIYNVLSG